MSMFDRGGRERLSIAAATVVPLAFWSRTAKENNCYYETVARIPATDRSGASRSHALRGNAVCDALRRLLAPGDIPPTRLLGGGRRAARQAFPRRAWEREPENRPVSLLQSRYYFIFHPG